jgi:hypothetical protein
MFARLQPISTETYFFMLRVIKSLKSLEIHESLESLEILESFESLESEDEKELLFRKFLGGNKKFLNHQKKVSKAHNLSLSLGCFCFYFWPPKHGQKYFYLYLET